MKIKMLVSKFQFYGFVRNIDADSGLAWVPHQTLFAFSRGHLNFENGPFFRQYEKFSFFDKSADMADFYEKKLGKVMYGSFSTESMIWEVGIKTTV